MAFGLVLVAEEGGVEFGIEATERFAEAIVLAAGEVGRIVGEFEADAGEVVAFGGDGLIEEAGEEAGFDTGLALDSELGERDALDGVALLGVDGAIAGHGVVAELGNSGEVFDADDGEGFIGEAVLAVGRRGGGHARTPASRDSTGGGCGRAVDWGRDGRERRSSWGRLGTDAFRVMEEANWPRMNMDKHLVF